MITVDYSYEDYRVDPYELAKAARKQAEARPDHVYSSADYIEGEEYNGGCSYTEKDGTLGCIFGHAMADLGMKLPDENSLPGLTHAYINGESWLTAFGDLDEDDEESQEALSVVEWMRYVQGKQDSRVAWGEAVRLADREYPDAVELTS